MMVYVFSVQQIPAYNTKSYKIIEPRILEAEAELVGGGGAGTQNSIVYYL